MALLTTLSGYLGADPVHSHSKTDKYGNTKEYYRFRVCDNKYKFNKESRQVEKVSRWFGGVIEKRKIEKKLPYLKKGSFVVVHTTDLDLDRYPKNAPPEQQKIEITLGFCDLIEGGEKPEGGSPTVQQQPNPQHQAVYTSPPAPRYAPPEAQTLPPPDPSAVPEVPPGFDDQPDLPF